MIPDLAGIRVVTWNVHSCVGRSGRFDPDSVVRTLKAVQPHIIALQEVDARRHVAGEVDTFAYLAKRIGGYSAAARTICTPDGDYGHMLLSRWPMTGVEHCDLSVPGKEPRVAIVAALDSPQLRVIAAHLGLSASERRRQLQVIRRAVESVPEQPCIVLGDFNEWRRRGLATRTLCPPLVPATSLASYPSSFPVLPLDRIWCRPPLQPVGAQVLGQARALSDHLPVMAELH